MTTARGHSVLEEADIVISRLSKDIEDPHIFFPCCTTGVQGSQCADRPRNHPCLDQVFKIDQVQDLLSHHGSGCAPEVRLARLATIQPTAVTPTSERYMKRQSTSMPYAGNTTMEGDQTQLTGLSKRLPVRLSSRFSEVMWNTIRPFHLP